MKTHKVSVLVMFCITVFYSHAQNLLNTSSWTVGSGSVSGFNQNGTTTENSRILGKNHIGQKVVLWKAKPDATSNSDGGWNTNYVSANHGTTYRFSVWIKKTNSTSGTTYLGFNANNSGSLRLDGSYNSNPYFWYGDLPKLNRWYLIVGYVHKSSHTGTSSIGGIYDGTTGEKVKTITDFKLKNNVTLIRHRSYLYYDTNTLDTQYFYEPRIDVVTGSEPSITELLKINGNSKAKVFFDTAGNQFNNSYCYDPRYCSLSARIEDNDIEKEVFSDLQAEEVNQEITDESILVYPNPTKNFVSISLGADILKQMQSIMVYNTNGTLLKEITKKEKITQIDLNGLSTGVYFLHIHLSKRQSITKKIVKH